MQILIADDNDINRQFLIGALEETSHETTEVINGEQAISACRRAHFDLILMDIRMPEVDGIEATTIIRQLPGYGMEETAIIALTADLQIQQQTDLFQLGFNNYLSKPISRQTLLDSIDTLEKVLREPSTQELIINARETAPIDRQAALSAAGGNRALVDKLTGMFASELTRFEPIIKAQIEQREYDQAREMVHKIRGSAAYCGARAIQQTCAALELSLTQKDGPQARVYFEQFCSQSKVLQKYLLEHPES